MIKKSIICNLLSYNYLSASHDVDAARQALGGTLRLYLTANEAAVDAVNVHWARNTLVNLYGLNSVILAGNVVDLVFLGLIGVFLR